VRRGNGPASALIATLTLLAVLAYHDPFGVAGVLEGRKVIGCDGHPVALDGREAELLRLHNDARQEHGLSPLCAQEQLMSAARAHSEDMIERDFYAHESPGGEAPGDRLTRAGYTFATCGENISRMTDPSGGEPQRDDLRRVFTGWMQSPGHRENLLNPAFREVGIGVATGVYAPEVGNTAMYTVDFGTRR
jgi:uncharacterized protein YkwD